MGNSYLSCLFSLQSKPFQDHQLTEPASLPFYSSQDIHKSLWTQISSIEIHQTDIAYESFKYHIQREFSKKFRSIFCFKRKFNIFEKELGEKYLLKAEFFVELIEEDCLAYFKSLSYLKENVLDYRIREKDEYLLINLEMKKQFFQTLKDCTFAFKCFRSGEVYWVGKNVGNWDEGCIIDYFGVCTYGKGKNGKTRVLGMVEIERCQWYVRDLYVEWFSRVVELMCIEMNKE